MSINENSRKNSATEWELQTANTLCDAFEHKIELEIILKLLQEKQSVDQVVDALFAIDKKEANNNNKEDNINDHQEEKDRVILIEDEEEEEEEEEQEDSEIEEIPSEKNSYKGDDDEEEDQEEVDGEEIEEIEDEEEEYDSAKESIPEEIEASEDLFESQASLAESKDDKVTVACSTLSTSAYNEIPLSQSIMTTIRTIAKTAEEKTVQTDESNVRFFQERIESLSQQLNEAIDAKNKVEDEKKNALKFCVIQVTAIKETVAEKEEIIAKQEQEIAQLRKQLEDCKVVSTPDSKFEKYITDSKVALMQGVESLSQQINENIAKVHTEFRNEDKEWIIVKRLQEFAVEFKKEMMDLFSKNSPLPPRAPVVIQPSQEKQEKQEKPTANSEDDRDFWQAEKASLESYIKELEDRLKFYEDQERAKSDSLIDLSSSITSASDLLVESLSNATINSTSLLDAPSVSSSQQSSTSNLLDSTTPAQQQPYPVQQPVQPVLPQQQQQGPLPPLAPFVFPPQGSNIWAPSFVPPQSQPYNQYWRVSPPTAPSYPPPPFGYPQYPNYRRY